MRECIRCKVLSSMDDLTNMEGSIWLHNDLELCDAFKKIKEQEDARR